MSTAVIAAGLVASTVFAFADGTAASPCDIQVANKTEADDCTTDAGAKVRYIGDSNTTFGSSGTGTFNPFVRLQASPSERGYNTDGTLGWSAWTPSRRSSGRRSA